MCWGGSVIVWEVASDKKPLKLSCNVVVITTVQNKTFTEYIADSQPIDKKTKQIINNTCLNIYTSKLPDTFLALGKIKLIDPTSWYQKLNY